MIDRTPANALESCRRRSKENPMVAIFPRLLSTVIATSLISQASALNAETQSNVLVASRQWSPNDEGFGHCGRETVVSGPPEQKLTIGAPPGQDAAVITLEGNPTKIGPINRPTDVALVLFPSGERFPASMLRFVRPDTDRATMVLSKLPEAFLQAFAAGEALNLQWKGRPYLQIRYSGAADPVAQLVACNDGLLRDWGLDVAQIDSLKSKPRPLNSAEIYSGADYPLTAMRRGEQGTAVIAFTVGVDGRAKDCSVVKSSGSSLLDGFSCDLMKSRARFSPGTDSNDQPTAVRVGQVVQWKML